MERRHFVKLCAASALGSVAAPALPADAEPKRYERARLVDHAGNPLTARDVPVNRNLIFHYPFVGTPCFLLNLGRPTRPSVELRTQDARGYEWHGGVGAQRSIVAYSAICAHRMTYPTRDISFISYRAEATPQSRFAHVIHCCSEHSQYDPAEGARVLAGPARQPLAAILLDYDERNDELFAVGTLGGEMFNDFFAKFGFRLGMEFKGLAHASVRGDCVVRELEQYCRQQVKC